MLKNLKNYWKALQKIRLTKEEKDVMYQKLALVMAQNPIPSESKKSSFFSSLLFVKRPFAFASLIVFFVVSTGAGVSYASENAQPGDLLYPVKVNVNEEVVGALQFSPKGKSEWEMERIKRRLAEIEKLAEEGILTEEMQAKIAGHLENHTGKVQKFIKKFEQDGDVTDAEDVTSNLKSVLEKHQVILENFSNPGQNPKNTQKPPLDEVLKIIKENGEKLPHLPIQQNEQEDETTLSLPKQEMEANGKEITQNHLSLTAEKLANISNFLADSEGKNPEVLAQMQENFNKWSALYAQAEEQVAAGEYEAAAIILAEIKKNFEETKEIMQNPNFKPFQQSQNVVENTEEAVEVAPVSDEPSI